MGSRGHLWRDRGLQGNQAKRHEQRQSISGDGTLASWPGNRRWQHARCFEIRERHCSLLQAEHPPPISCAISEGRVPESRCRTSLRVRNWNEHVAPASLLACRVREWVLGEKHAAVLGGWVETKFCRA